MKLLHLCKGKSAAGFTFLEIILVVAILTVVFGLGIPILYQFYTRYQLDSEYQLLHSLLAQARNSAMINRNESSHGFFMDSNNFMVFQGSSYASRSASEDRIFPRSGAISVNGPAELVFSSLAGATASSTFILNNAYSQKTVYVNSEGLIY